MLRKCEIYRTLRLKRTNGLLFTPRCSHIVHNSCANITSTFKMKETPGALIRTPEGHLLSTKLGPSWHHDLFIFQHLQPAKLLSTTCCTQARHSYIPFLPLPFHSQHKNKSSCGASSDGSRICKHQWTVLWIQCGKIYNLLKFW